MEEAHQGNVVLDCVVICILCSQLQICSHDCSLKRDFGKTNLRGPAL